MHDASMHGRTQGQQAAVAGAVGSRSRVSLIHARRLDARYVLFGAFLVLHLGPGRTGG